MTKKIIICLNALLCFPFIIMANVQDSDSLKITQAKTDSIFVGKKDTVVWVQDQSIVDKHTEKLIMPKMTFKPNPTRAVIYSAIFPGLGQIYNRKYWKLPLIYGGFLGLTYAISWNGKYYNDYTAGYKALMSSNPRSAENIAIWGPFLKGNRNPENLTDSELVTLTSSFKRNRDSYRRYRDLSIIGAIALYALCMIDAYVDAHLFDFNISPDLSMKVVPVSMNPSGLTNRFSEKSFGVQCSIQF